MQRPYNSFAHQKNSNPNSSTSGLLPQLVPRPNFSQNSFPMQPQMGIMNHQIPFSSSNSNVPPETQLMPQTNFLNASNPFLFAQNNHMALPQPGHMFPLHGNFSNMPQNIISQGQIFSPNFSNLPQQLNQNLALSNGQMCLQTLNQILSMQMSNPSVFGNTQIGLMNQNQQNFVQPMLNDVSGYSGTPIKSSLSEAHGRQNLHPSASMRSQGSKSNSNWKNGPGKKFPKNATREQSQRFQKSQVHQMNNAKRKFGFDNDKKAKGYGNGNAKKFGQTNFMNQAQEKKRKSLALTYSEQEIKQWCEARRKNYPTKANIHKKLAGKQSNSDDIDKEAKMRCEQLKEILAKQAELGVEVAEIPSYYLSNSEKQVCGRMENTRPLNKRGRSRNKHDVRGKCNRRDKFGKEKLADQDSSSNTSSFNNKKPTLLRKLLRADINRDKSHLLQAFRFLAMNSFFKDCPKALRFPLCTVKEGDAGDMAGEKSFLSGKEVSDCRSGSVGECFNPCKHGNDEKSIERMDHDIQDPVNYDNGNIGEESARPEEEEGEIID